MFFMSEEIIENNEQTVDQEPQTAETQSLVPGFKSICFRIGVMMIVVFAARIAVNIISALIVPYLSET